MKAHSSSESIVRKPLPDFPLFPDDGTNLDAEEVRGKEYLSDQLMRWEDPEFGDKNADRPPPRASGRMVDAIKHCHGAQTAAEKPAIRSLAVSDSTAAAVRSLIS
jgi:hypothetical protein